MVSSSFNEVEGLLECGERPQSRPRQAQWQIASSYRLSRVFVVAKTVRVSAERSTPRFIVPDQDPPRTEKKHSSVTGFESFAGNPACALGAVELVLARGAVHPSPTNSQPIVTKPPRCYVYHSQSIESEPNRRAARSTSARRPFPGAARPATMSLTRPPHRAARLPSDP